MAIKISSQTVIDDTKNIINVVNGNFSGIVTAARFVGSGIGLTDISTNGQVFFISARDQ